VRFEVFLQVNNRFDLSADTFLVEGFTVLEMSEMSPDADDFDMGVGQFPKLIFLKSVGVFRIPYRRTN